VAGKGCALAVLALAVCAIAVVPAAGDDNFYVTSSDTSTNVWGGDYVGGSARKAYNWVSNSGTVFSIDSLWDNGYTGAKSYWDMADGSKILVTSSAEIQNNMRPELIYARDFEVRGDNTGEVIEFQAGFNADLGTESSPAGGLSTMRLHDCTLITHATQNLPAIWKYIPDGGGSALSHHGLLTFTSGPNGVWQVRTNSQEYEGGTYWKYDWELDVASGISLTYVDTWVERHETGDGADIGFGPYTGTHNTTFTKTGDGTLNLNGEMGWQENSTMAVQDGTVNFNHYDPGKVWTYGYMGAIDPSGQYLTINISPGATVNFDNPIDDAGAEHVTREWGVEEIDNSGTFTMDAGQLDISGDYTANSTTGIALWNADVDSTKITVDGTNTIAGELSLSIGDDYTPAFGDVFTLFDDDGSGTLSGQFDTVAGVSIDSGDKALAVTYDTSAEQVLCEVALPGDATLDTNVDVSDLSVMGSTYNTASGAVWEDADFNGDGAVDVSDLSVLGANYGRSYSLSVPEPATLALLGLGGIAAIIRRRR
jgi:hypothetical protein